MSKHFFKQVNQELYIILYYIINKIWSKVENSNDRWHKPKQEFWFFQCNNIIMFEIIPEPVL